MPTILVTGGGRGIGRAIALAFAGPGSTIAIAARTQSELDATGDAIRDRGAEPVLLPVDVTDELSVAAGYARLRKVSPRIDVLVNNAGVGGGRPIHEADSAGWRRILDTNVWGTFLVTREAVPIVTVNDRTIGSGKPGPVTWKLLEGFRRAADAS